MNPGLPNFEAMKRHFSEARETEQANLAAEALGEAELNKLAHLSVVDGERRLLAAIDALNNEITGLRGETANLRAEFNGLRGEFDGLRGEFNGLRGEFNGLSGKQAAMELRITTSLREETARLREERVAMEARLTLNQHMIIVGISGHNGIGGYSAIRRSARAYNRVIGELVQLLPLLTDQGVVPPNFPQTLAAINGLSSDIVASLLRDYGQRVPRTVAQRRQALRNFLTTPA